MKTFKSIEQYISQYEGEVHSRLKMIQNLLIEVFSKAEQTIRYNMPTFRVDDKDVMYFAAYKKHISIMPTSYTIERFADRLTSFETTSSSIKFLNSEPLPLELIREIAEWNMKAVEAGKLYESAN